MGPLMGGPAAEFTAAAQDDNSGASMPLVPPLPEGCVLPASYERSYDSPSPIVVTGSRADRSGAVRSAVQPSPPPPPARPPPPPPPAPRATAAPAVTVNAQLLEQSSATNLESVVERLPQFQPRCIPAVRPTDLPDREQYAGEQVAPANWAHENPVSTFSVDVDTAAYANARRSLLDGNLPPKASVRTEEMINYFRYDYPAPTDIATPFSVSTDMAVTPWNDATRLLRIGLRGYDLNADQRPPANLVFLLDVSGSMGSPDKLPLVQTAMKMLAAELTEQDRVSIVVYAGAAGVVLEPTNDECDIRIAIENLRAGGSTAGGAGIQLAYDIARGSFIEGGVNRVILATDGDFNVGIRNHDRLIEMIEEKRKSGITLTTLGFGTGNLNDAMMEQIADHGNGNYAYFDSAMEARKVLSQEMSSTLFTIAHDVKIQVEFNPAKVSQYRLIGYENRALREEDFDNDAVDTGEIGAGHQVTAIYEIVPTGAEGWMRERRYAASAPADASDAVDELAFVQLRYKLRGEDTSKLIQRPVPSAMMDRAGPASGDMAFASAVAAYGQVLRGDTLMNGYTLNDAARLAGRQSGYWRSEFVQLASLAGALDGR